jgi:D-alanyl-D-alanine carboxypeptidase
MLGGLKPNGFIGLGMALLALLLTLSLPARAADLPSLGRDAAIVIDGVNGRVLYERDAYEIRYPASLTKMMTLYLLFEAFDEGKLTFESELPTSSYAASQSPTKLNLRPGETIPAKTAMEAIVVRSANDVAVVVAEALGGTEDGFARLMTQKAGEIGMLNTHFANASGLPDAQQISTAADMALLGRRLAYDFPQYYPFLSVTEFSFKGQHYTGHNNLIGAFEGTDGIKTGYTRASGFNLVSSVVRGNRHVIGVVMGGTTAASRDQEMKRLLGIAFDEADKNPMLLAYANVPWQEGEGPKTSPVWGNTPSSVVLAAFGPQRHSTPPAANTVTVASLQAAEPIVLPIDKPLGLRMPDNTLASIGPSQAAYPGSDLIGSLIENGDEEATAGVTPMLVPMQKPELVQASISEIEQGDIGGPADFQTARRWSVQIGAFADEATANAQLEMSATRSNDVLATAERLIVPLAAEGGRTLYRARFGLFAESEAYAVCRQMMTRGETCFAAENDDGT